MDNDIALEALKETAKDIANDLPVEIIDKCYRLMVNRSFDKDIAATHRLFEIIINDYLDTNGIQ